jgi:hypothetical protein
MLVLFGHMLLLAYVSEMSIFILYIRLKCILEGSKTYVFT